MKNEHCYATSVVFLIRVCIIQLALSIVLPSITFAQTPKANSNTAIRVTGTVRDENSNEGSKELVLQ